MTLPQTVIPEHLEVALGAIVAAVRTDDGPTPLQLEMLRAVSHQMLGSEIDPATVAPRSPEQLAAVITDANVRRLVVALMVTLEFVVRGEPSAVAERVEEYARALGIDGPMVRAARHLADQQAALLYFDIQRNSLYTAEAIHGALHGELFELIRSKLAYQGIAADAHIAHKWRALRECPAGSWGRGVVDFYAAHNFPFPGERHGISELGAQHDFVHVLAEYDATPEGEIDVFAFIAASMNDSRGLTQFAFTLGLFQNGSIRHVAGKRVVIARTDTLEDPGAVARWADAVSRGEACTVDVMAGIDHFALAGRDLTELRAEFGIRPKA